MVMNVRRWALAGLAAIAACNRPAPQAKGPNVVTITTTEYAFAMPDTVPAGLTTLRLVNQGKELHHASLVRLGEGKTMADFQTGLAAAMKRHAPPPPWMTLVGGPNTVTPGDTGVTTQNLESGRYVVVCWIPSLDGIPHVMKGMFHPLAVTAPAAPSIAAELATDVTIRLTDYAFQLSQPLSAGKHVVRVENTGAQGHEIVIAALAPGKTVQDFTAWEAGGENGPVPTGRWLGGLTTIDAGAHSQFTTTLAPGNYLLLCFWPDAKDGKPHIEHGMAREIAVN
jgi:hypothetical protein